MMNQSPIDPQIFEDIYDIEPISWYQNPWNIGLLILGLLVMCTLLGLLFYWFHSVRNKAWRVALRDVAEIESQLSQLSPEASYQKISGALRKYCHNAKICAHDVTDQELFTILLQKIPDQSAALVDMIDHIKKTKFAQFTPAHESVLTDLARLKVFIEQTNYL